MLKQKSTSKLKGSELQFSFSNGTSNKPDIFDRSSDFAQNGPLSGVDLLHGKQKFLATKYTADIII